MPDVALSPLTITPLGPAIGARVEGMDLSIRCPTPRKRRWSRRWSPITCCSSRTSR